MPTKKPVKKPAASRSAKPAARAAKKPVAKARAPMTMNDYVTIARKEGVSTKTAQGVVRDKEQLRRAIYNNRQKLKN